MKERCRGVTHCGDRNEAEMAWARQGNELAITNLFLIKESKRNMYEYKKGCQENEGYVDIIECAWRNSTIGRQLNNEQFSPVCVVLPGVHT
jgi:hypothetical protein